MSWEKIEKPSYLSPQREEGEISPRTHDLKGKRRKSTPEGERDGEGDSINFPLKK